MESRLRSTRPSGRNKAGNVQPAENPSGMAPSKDFAPKPTTTTKSGTSENPFEAYFVEEDSLAVIVALAVSTICSGS
jgi:hypothetical protein